MLVGARGPKTLRLAGEVSDGVLLDAEVTGPDELRRGRALAQEGRDAGGRAGPVAGGRLQPRSPPTAVTPDAVAERVGQLAEAGADTVVLQSDAARPDPRALVAALA